MSVDAIWRRVSLLEISETCGCVSPSLIICGFTELNQGLDAIREHPYKYKEDLETRPIRNRFDGSAGSLRTGNWYATCIPVSATYSYSDNVNPV